ncbi:MAG: SipW-dependent-type signal peptide-containing protein, partial [Acutalibacteraceae bacterium]|nr:SipW-dependent-type signal peptide-containing protein [Acutalibacteraceae bacterium]
MKKQFRKTLLLGLSFVLVAALAIGGTVAYLQDDDSDVNVMTLGNVSIAQHEYERVVENGEYKKDTINGAESYVLKEFTQGKPLLPATEIDANGNPYNNG